jgi:alkylated DNA repair dioxygenase AlkB
VDLPPGFTWLPDVFDAAASAATFAALREATPWQDHALRIFGRAVPMPRRIAYYGEYAYAYSGIVHPAAPLPALLLALRDRAAALAGQPFNVALLNLYRDGRDAMGWHSDDDYPCGDHPGVASLSFGATRRLRLRSRAQPRRSLGLDLTAGGVLLMTGRSQLDWQHAVPKTARPTGERINLTFRWMAAAQGAPWSSRGLSRRPSVRGANQPRDRPGRQP